MTANPYETGARLAKATALADVGQAVGMTADLAPGLDSDWWAEAAKVANVNPPSPAAIELVVELLRRREHLAATPAPADPFLGVNEGSR